MASNFDNIASYDMFTKAIDGDNAAGLGSGHICLKRTIMYTIQAVNVLFLILGITLTAVGSAGTSNTYSAFAGETLPVGILVVGVFIMLVSILGCCGARSESRPLLAGYSIILVILIICQFSIGVAVYVKQDQAPQLLTSAWDNANNWQRTVIQNNLLCCGLTVFNRTQPANVVLPLSGLAGQPCPLLVVAGTVCMPLMLTSVQSSYVTVGVVAVVFAFIQIIGFLITLCLIRGIRIARDQQQMVDQTIDAQSYDTPAGTGQYDTPANPDQPQL